MGSEVMVELRHMTLRDDTWPEDGRPKRGLGAQGSSSGEPQGAPSEGVTWPKLTMAGNGWKAGVPHPEGHAQTFLAGRSS